MHAVDLAGAAVVLNRLTRAVGTARGHDGDLATTAPAAPRHTRSEVARTLTLQSSIAMQPGDRLGHYVIVSHIGSGGMGAVYRATDTRLGRDIALKVLPASMAGDPERLARFRREARTVAALNHPHIVTLHSVEEDAGTHFLTMELVEGRSLDKEIPGGGLPLDRIVDIGAAVADALDAAHDRGIVHRDLKPGNIVVAADDGRVKVLDFGLAKSIGDGPGAADAATVLQTGIGVVMGTLPYMSPEQATGRAVDSRTDIFAFGDVLYEMATGRRPFNAASPAELTTAILRDHPRPIAETRVDLPDALQHIIDRCLAKDPRERYGRIADVGDDLRTLRRSREEPPAWAGSRGPAASAVAAGPTSTTVSPPLVDPRSIAVLPFENLSADPQNEFFSDGLAEDILNALGHVSGLRVAARTSSFSFRDTASDIRAIGAVLRVAHVLEGSVRRAGTRVRVTVQLVEAATGYRIWSDRYDRELSDIFEVQDEIARAIAGQLEGALGVRPGGRLVRLATKNMEAYDLYLQGRAQILRRGRGIEEGARLFQRAVDLDPDFAPAWAGLADAYTVRGQWGLAPPDETMPQAIEAARRAIALDDGLGEAHCALGGALMLYERDFAGAEREFRRGLELNPQHTQGRVWYALFCGQWIHGRMEEGVSGTREALDRDPLSAYAMSLHAFALGTARRTSEAVAMSRRAIAQDPDSLLSRWIHGHCCHWDGRFGEAVAAFEMAAVVSGRAPYVLEYLCTTYADWGRAGDARLLYDEVMARAAEEYTPRAGLALAAAAAGHMDRAIDLAEESFAAREPALVLYGRHFPDYWRLRADPRFTAILERLALPA
jgi:serine/threonine protein kinase/tetratricopeptide (TPR) repeat protein